MFDDQHPLGGLCRVVWAAAVGFWVSGLRKFQGDKRRLVEGADAGGFGGGVLQIQALQIQA